MGDSSSDEKPSFYEIGCVPGVKKCTGTKMDCGKAIAHTIVLKIGTCTYYATVSFPNI